MALTILHKQYFKIHVIVTWFEVLLYPFDVRARRHIRSFPWDKIKYPRWSYCCNDIHVFIAFLPVLSDCAKNEKTNEPWHDKTNKMSVRPVKTQISLGIRPVWSESSLCAQWVAKDSRFLHADSEDWSDWADGCTAILMVLSCRGSYAIISLGHHSSGFIVPEHDIFEPQHNKNNKMNCVPNEDSDQPGHPPSLISLRRPHKETLGP